MSNFRAEDLSNVLSEFLRNRTILDFETHPLTASGENYGSDILSLTLHLSNNGNSEKVAAVAKLPPPGKLMKEMFNSPVTFRNEVKFYTAILPELRKFTHEKLGTDLDFFAECYGARISLKPHQRLADDQAVLIVENLTKSGFGCVNRFDSFDLATSELVLETLATFHASTLALRQLEPGTFAQFDDFFPRYRTFDLGRDKSREHLQNLINTVENVEGCREFSGRLRKALEPCLDSAIEEGKNSPKYLKQPWISMIHSDAWTNNFMVKFSGEGKPERCKIIDWQLFELGSPARDVVFLIFTSIQPRIVQEHFHNLVELYHGKFVDTVKRFGVDTKPFTLDSFHVEMRRVTRLFEVFRVLMMLEPIFKPKEDAKALDNLTVEDFGRKTISEQQKARTAFVVKEFAKLNFI